MLHHFVVMAWRSLTRHKAYTFINLFGLAAGLASCLLLLLFVRHELSYDLWLPDAERIAQLQLTLEDPRSEPVPLQMAPYPAAAALTKDFPQIEAAAGSFTARPIIVQNGVGTLPERDALMADADFFDIVALPFRYGSPAKALSEANSVALSEAEAIKRFGRTDALGRTMTIIHRGRTRDVTVTGVFADIPANSHLRFPMVFRLNPSDYADEPALLGDWDNISGYVYAKLRPGADADQLNAALEAWARRNMPARDKAADGSGRFRLVPVRDVHLGPNQVAAMSPGSDARSIATFAGIALLILAVACFNFINLATARATRRAREVGVRKVLGASRFQLIGQFVTESALIVVAAMLIALALVEVTLPEASRILGARLAFNYFGPDGLWPHILALTLLVSAAGGLYPAFHLARFRPARVLKATNASPEGPGSGRLRNALAFAQFSVVIGLTICTAVIYAQTEHARNVAAGYERKGLLRVDNVDREPIRSVSDSLVREIKRLEGVESVGRSSIAPGSGNVSVAEVTPAGGRPPVSLGMYKVDADFFATMGTKILAGRGFSERFALDDSSLPAPDDEAAQRALAARGTSILVSALAANRLGFATPAAALGRQVQLDILDAGQGMVPATIVGVVEDVRYRSVRTELEPIAYRLTPNAASYIVIRFSGDSPDALIGKVRALWRARASDLPFEAVAVEDAMARMYDSDAARGQVFAWSSLLAVAIGCLGLFGLAAFVAERRTREIALRKVFGAGVPDIVRLLVWQFSRPVLFANLLAWPIAWWLMRDWLNGFDDRIALSPAYFIGAGTLAALVALGSVVGQTVKVAWTRPIDSLRYE